MAKLVVSEEVSLDGVLQDPTGEEGFRHGGWFNRVGEETRRAWAEVKTKEAFAATALLHGRKTDEWFGSRWSTREGEWADRLNSLPKYVVSSTLEHPDWNNSRILKGDAVTEVSKLKQELNGEIVIPASYQLGRTLIEHDLVDEIRLVVFPVALGAGEQFFGEMGQRKPMRLVDTWTIGDGLVMLTYQFTKGA